MNSTILIIIKPAVFDHSIYQENGDDIFLAGVEIPGSDILLDQLFLDIVNVYR